MNCNVISPAIVELAVAPAGMMLPAISAKANITVVSAKIATRVTVAYFLPQRWWSLEYQNNAL